MAKRYTKEEDMTLVSARKQGMSYDKIHSDLLPDRGVEALRMRYGYLRHRLTSINASINATEWNEGTTHPQFVERTTGEGFVRDESAPVLACDGLTLVWVRWTRETTEYYETLYWRSIPDGKQVRVRYWMSIPTPPDMVLA